MPVKKSSANSRQSSEKKTKTIKITSKVKVDSEKTTSPRGGLTVPVFSLVGKETGTLTLPKEIFGQKVNKQLLAQAVRAYLTNKKSLTGSTKTRSEVEGSTAKIFRQKGTGRARHGAIRAPIFVGGGIALGPKSRVVRLSLPRGMKKAALISALSDKALEKQVMGFSGLEKASGKTKEIVQLLGQVASIKGQEKKTKKQVTALIVTDGKMDNVVRGVRNIPGVNVLPAALLNAYEVISHKVLFFTKESVEFLIKKDSSQSKVKTGTK